MSLIENQQEHVNEIYKLFTEKPKPYKSIPLKNNNIIIDISDVGTGKTYTSCYLSRVLKKPLFVIGIKDTIEKWYNIAEEFGAEVIGITNYEMLRSATSEGTAVKWYDMRDKYTEKATICPFVVKKEDNDHEYIFNLKNTLIVFDEYHKGRNKNTYNSGLIVGAKNSHSSNSILLLSATPIESDCNIKFLFYLVGYLSSSANNSFAKKEFSNFCNIMNVAKDNKLNMDKVRDLLINSPIKRMVKMTRTFEGTIKTYKMQMDDKTTNKINKYNNIIQLKRTEMQGIFSVGDILGKITKAMRKIEKLKAPYMAHRAIQKYIEGFSVVVFLNYKRSADKIAEIIKEQTGKRVGILTSDYKDKKKNIERFQRDKIRFIVCTLGSGSSSIDLQDINGKYRRYTIISMPSYATTLIQCVGRVDRRGQKSFPEQEILFTNEENTIEALIENSMRNKLCNINKLNGDDILYFL